MPTSTVRETREHEDEPARPAINTFPVAHPTWVPETRVLRRRRRKRGKSVLRWFLRGLAVAAIALALLLLFQGTAEAQTPIPTPIPIPSSKKRPSSKEQPSSRDPSGAENPSDSEKSEGSRPDSIQSWIDELARKNGKSGSKPPADQSGQAPETSNPTPPPSPPAGPAPAVEQPEVTRPPVTPSSGPPRREAPPGPDRRVDAGRSTPAPRPTSGNRDSDSDPAPPIDFAANVKPLSETGNEDLAWIDTFDLIVALEKEFSSHPPVVNLGALRQEIYGHLISLSVALDHNDNPRDNLDELRAYAARVMGLHATVRDEASLDRLLPRSVLATRRGSPTGVGLILFVLSDLVSKYLELEPIMVRDTLALRYRSGSHRYTLIPTRMDRLYSDREFLAWATGQPEPSPDQKIRVLTRQEFWGTVLAEGGAALLSEGKTARASRLLTRSIELFPGQPLPHIAMARVLMDRNDIAGAREELDLAIRLAPNHERARFERASILETLGDHDTLARDLRWLAHEAKNPLASVRLIRHYLDRMLFRDAEREFLRLRGQDLPPSMKAELDRLALDVGAAPWIARLRGSPDAGDRFEAIDELRNFPTRGTLLALVDTLEDRNLRLGAYAHKTLLELSRMDIEKDAAAWRAALERLPRK